ncbi:hypothetical protein PR048_017913 [Dryococelus australis]|uniref:Uncharacterized protein n=1 Tax=Dryococelus australis TaxID=614101 RepID=A0ABQ9HAT5_9NEOP|nr:hypothetical protein PR048_017913 [Dryococelus australis]
MWNSISNDFYAMWDFTNGLGALDVSHNYAESRPSLRTYVHGKLHTTKAKGIRAIVYVQEYVSILAGMIPFAFMIRNFCTEIACPTRRPPRGATFDRRVISEVLTLHAALARVCSAIHDPADRDNPHTWLRAPTRSSICTPTPCHAAIYLYINTRAALGHDDSHYLSRLWDNQIANFTELRSSEKSCPQATPFNLCLRTTLQARCDYQGGEDLGKDLSAQQYTTYGSEPVCSAATRRYTMLRRTEEKKPLIPRAGQARPAKWRPLKRLVTNSPAISSLSVASTATRTCGTPTGVPYVGHAVEVMALAVEGRTNCRVAATSSEARRRSFVHSTGSTFKPSGEDECREKLRLVPNYKEFSSQRLKQGSAIRFILSRPSLAAAGGERGWQRSAATQFIALASWQTLGSESADRPGRGLPRLRVFTYHLKLSRPRKIAVRKTCSSFSTFLITHYLIRKLSRQITGRELYRARADISLRQQALKKWSGSGMLERGKSKNPDSLNQSYQDNCGRNVPRNSLFSVVRETPSILCGLDVKACGLDVINEAHFLPTHSLSGTSPATDSAGFKIVLSNHGLHCTKLFPFHRFKTAAPLSLALAVKVPPCIVVSNAVSQHLLVTAVWLKVACSLKLYGKLYNHASCSKRNTSRGPNSFLSQVVPDPRPHCSWYKIKQCWLPASSGTIPTCENLVNRPGIEPGSPRWKAGVLIAQPPCPQWRQQNTLIMLQSL